jgi:hypothetical protein
MKGVSKMIGPQYTNWTVSADPNDPLHVHRFRREKTYFLFGLIPIWHISEEHNAFEAQDRGEQPEEMN